MDNVIVIGGGPGGLAASMMLSRAGLDVTLLEKQAWVGGRTSTLEDEGFRFDRGPTFFLYPRVLREIFHAVGYDLDREIEMVKLDPQYRLIFEQGGVLDATPDIPRMQDEIAKFNPADASRFVSYMEENREKLEKFRPVLENPFSSLRDLITPTMAKMLPLVRPWSSVDGDLKRFFSDPRVRLAFTFQAKYLGMSPFKCPSLFTILSFLEYEHGVFHPVGGCGAVSDVMARIATELGTNIRLGEGVEEIMFEGRRAVGVRTREGEYRADAVVVNADFAHAMQHLVPDRLRRRWTNAKLARKKYSCSTFMLYLGIDGQYDDVAHHNIYLPETYRENLKDIEQRHTLAENPAVYVQNASITDPTLAPKGMSTVYVLVPVTHKHENVDWSKEAPRFRELAVRQLAKVGMPDIAKRIRVEHRFTPADWERSGIYRGATFNLAHNLMQMLHLRPQNRFEDLDGMYIVGGGTHPGSGLPVIYEGARISSRLLLEDAGQNVDWLAPGLSSPAASIKPEALAEVA